MLLAVITELALCVTVAAPQGQGSAALAPLPPKRFGLEQARHLLVRAGFGGSPEEVRALHARGLEGAVRWLVDYEGLADPIGPHGLAPLRVPPRVALERLSAPQRRELAVMRRQADRENLARLQAWWVARMLRSPRPLEEKMTLLWADYFGAAHRRVRDTFALAVHQDALREHATGNFGVLLDEMVHDPAVLIAWGNVHAHRRSPSLRFARALLERFTVGPEGFGEQDVVDVARAFTGWGIRPGATVFRFEPRDHDWGRKVVLGRRGAWNGTDVVRLLLGERATARHVAGRIVRFLAAEPPAEVLEALADELWRSGYEIKPLLRALFRSRWFYGPDVVGRQRRTALATAVGIARALGAGSDAAPRIARLVERWGEPLLDERAEPPTPGPRPSTLARALLGAWRSAPVGAEPRRPGSARPAIVSLRRGARRMRGVAAARANGPRDLARVLIGDAQRPEQVLARLEERLLAVPLASEHRRRLLAVLAGRDDRGPKSKASASATRERIWQAVRLLVSLPEFGRQ